MPAARKASRAHWNSKVGFVLAAAGSAVGLGNIWKFPYITGEHGGGAFLLVYLACIALIGVPVLVGELLLGRAARSSPVNAFRHGVGAKSPWVGFGVLAVVGAFALLSYYSTVAGWSLHYTYLSVTNQLAGLDAGRMPELFDQLLQSEAVGLTWQMVFLLLTTLVVAGGVSSGLERCARVLMPALAILLLLLLGKAATLPGWSEGLDFLFGLRFDGLTAAGVLEALGHSFFTLSVGMGTMLTYGSYLAAKDDLVSAGAVTAGVDTVVAVVAAMVVFPVVFSFGLEPGAGPGLLFVTLPTALAQMTGGAFLSVGFFLMLAFAAFTSAISLLEVVVAYLIDNHRFSRRKACWLAGAAVAAFGVPATVSGRWFDGADFLVSNLILPSCGLGVALFVGWKLQRALRRQHFVAGSALAGCYRAWLWMVKYPVPAAIAVIFLKAVGAFDWLLASLGAAGTG